ncbi:MAG: hypothetical protein BIFFINMI_03674 [Phycisphaerae bacterium]|nr:hypothetical protein [Phycisphaerae bacterium]
MRIRAIVCEVLHREFCCCAARSRNVVDLEFLSQGLHDLGAARMQARIQERIDAADASRYDAVVLGFALCNNGVVGLHSRSLPLIVPKAHDCITLFFGSHRRYMDYFNSHPGTYFMTTGWHERDHDNLEDFGGGVMGQLGISRTYQEYVEKYGEENAKYLMETLGDWRRNYRRMTHIEMGVADETPAREHARAEAARHGWEFEAVPGDLAMIQRLLDGPWDAGEFLRLEPGRSVRATGDDNVLGEEPPQPPASDT